MVEVLLDAGMDINYEVCLLTFEPLELQLFLHVLPWPKSWVNLFLQHFPSPLPTNAIRIKVKVSSPFAKDLLCYESTAGCPPPDGVTFSKNPYIEYFKCFLL